MWWLEVGERWVLGDGLWRGVALVWWSLCPVSHDVGWCGLWSFP